MVRFPWISGPVLCPPVRRRLSGCVKPLAPFVIFFWTNPLIHQPKVLDSAGYHLTRFFFPAATSF